MEKLLKGKYLVRKSKLEDGTPIITLTGVFYPKNFNIDDIKDNDEMWVSDIIIGDGVRFTDPVGIDGGSPEEFLGGENMSPSCWKTKGDL